MVAGLVSKSQPTVANRLQCWLESRNAWPSLLRTGADDKVSLSGENFVGNGPLFQCRWNVNSPKIAKMAARLAWLRHQTVPVIPIMGARKVSQLQDKLASLDLELSAEQLKSLDG